MLTVFIAVRIKKTQTKTQQTTHPNLSSVFEDIGSYSYICLQIVCYLKEKGTRL